MTAAFVAFIPVAAPGRQPVRVQLRRVINRFSFFFLKMIKSLFSLTRREIRMRTTVTRIYRPPRLHHTA